MDRDLSNVPGFWELIEHLAQRGFDANDDAWHSFSIQFRAADGCVLVADANLSRTPLGFEPTGPIIAYSSPPVCEGDSAIAAAVHEATNYLRGEK
jgi:hypothetical protein